jgi:2,3-bisphosphoglycerate-independent phosphoglycerate mutase
MTSSAGTTLLLILDGWGHSDSNTHNAISQANTPVWDRLMEKYPHTLIQTSGLQVGLPEGQMGNSEVGHMNLGAGRVVYQSLTRIDKDIADGGFFNNPTLCHAADDVIAQGSALHIIGLLSPGGIHSHENQIAAMVDLAHQRGCRKIYLHALLDGRDTPPRSAAASIKKFEDKFAELHCGQIATIAGRFFGMDRDQRWDRVEKAFNPICHGKAEYENESASAALEAAYARDENDEFVQPTVITNGTGAVSIKDNDAIIFMNFRADRSRELTRVFTDKEFQDFDRGELPSLSRFVMLTQYSEDIDADCAYPPEKLANVLGEYLSAQHKTQLRIAETEKYAHVTFFFSGGRESEYDGEKRILIPSPKVDTYDLMPEMSAHEVTDKLVSAIKNREFDTIICNYANGDMVGHTGIWDAALKAAEVVDECLQRITDAILEVDGNCLITADHGNLEQMMDETTGQALTSHTNGPVPLIYVGKRNLSLKDGGSLCDIAPSILSLMALPQPKEMTGKSLIKNN